MINLEVEYITLVKKILIKLLPNDARVLVFGSRITDNIKPYSDLDLAIDLPGGKKLSLSDMANFKEAFDESDLPYKVDIVDLNNIDSNFKQHIISNNKILINNKVH